MEKSKINGTVLEKYVEDTKVIEDTIPYGITKIDIEAFANCQSLNTIKV